MGDEASKKDLQTLQANVNKQVTDLKKQIADLEKALADMKTFFNKEVEEVNKITVNVNQNLSKRLDVVDGQISQLQGIVGGLTSKVARLESE